MKISLPLNIKEIRTDIELLKKYCKFISCTPQYIYSPNSTGCSSFSFAFSTGVLSPAPFSPDVLPFSGLSVLSALSVVVFFAILFTGFSQTEMAAILSITMVTCKETAGYVWLNSSIGEFRGITRVLYAQHACRPKRVSDNINIISK